MLTGRSQLAGVLGWPVDHSLSPRLHGFWLEKYAIDGAYLPLPTPAEDLVAAVRGLAAVGFRGANVTVPHKQAAFAVCDDVTPFARRAGAVNTLVFEDRRRLVGSNTDGEGFLRSLAAHGIGPGDGPALVLGAGGAARAITAALLDCGMATTISARRPFRAEALVAQLPGLAMLPWNEGVALTGIGLLVNATSGGMTGAAPLEYDLRQVAERLVVADIVYTPRRTPLLAAASAHGLRTVEGIDMLLHQAALGFEAWFGIAPVIDEDVRRFVLAG